MLCVFEINFIFTYIFKSTFPTHGVDVYWIEPSNSDSYLFKGFHKLFHFYLYNAILFVSLIWVWNLPVWPCLSLSLPSENLYSQQSYLLHVSAQLFPTLVLSCHSHHPAVESIWWNRVSTPLLLPFPSLFLDSNTLFGCPYFALIAISVLCFLQWIDMYHISWT